MILVFVKSNEKTKTNYVFVHLSTFCLNLSVALSHCLLGF